MSDLTNTRIDADPTDGRSVYVPAEDNPLAATNAISALMKSHKLAEKLGKEWTPADAYLATRRFMKRRYR